MTYLDEEQKYEKLENYLIDNRLNVADFFRHLNSKGSSLLDLRDDVYNKYCDEFCKIKKDLDKFKKDKKHIMSKQERGKSLERLVYYIIEGYDGILKEITNLRTHTNEIDLVIKFDRVALQCGLKDVYSFMADGMLGECKNYQDGVSVTYVGKFYSLLRTCNFKVGVIFSINGVSGSNWSYGNGLIRKIALSDKTVIIDFNYEDFYRIYNKSDNFFNILNRKYESLLLDIDYSNYIKKHELQDALKEELISAN